MKYVYPAVFHPEDEGGFSVFFPDIERGATQGDTVVDCIEMAQDFLCLALYRMEEDGAEMPTATNLKKIKTDNEEIVTLISVDTDDYRRYYENKLIKKTLNIPSWLNERAEKAGVNFSQTLQKALKEELQIAE